MTQVLRLAYIGGGRYPDPEPWGKAFSFSGMVHAILILLMMISIHNKLKEEPATVLQEVHFIEKPVGTVQGTVVQEGISKPTGSGTRIGPGTTGKGYIKAHG